MNEQITMAGFIFFFFYCILKDKLLWFVFEASSVEQQLHFVLENIMCCDTFYIMHYFQIIYIVMFLKLFKENYAKYCNHFLLSIASLSYKIKIARSGGKGGPSVFV